MNLHGGFLVGFALLGIYFVQRSAGLECARAFWRKRARVLERKHWRSLGSFRALFTLANPYGYQAACPHLPVL